jgi:hypothetical protein
VLITINNAACVVLSLCFCCLYKFANLCSRMCGARVSAHCIVCFPHFSQFDRVNRYCLQSAFKSKRTSLYSFASFSTLDTRVCRVARQSKIAVADRCVVDVKRLQLDFARSHCLFPFRFQTKFQLIGVERCFVDRCAASLLESAREICQHHRPMSASLSSLLHALKHRFTSIYTIVVVGCCRYMRFEVVFCD